jgi:hypothetical protein
MTAKHTPSFLLKHIDPQKIFADYKDGLYYRPITDKSKIKLSATSIILAPVYSKSNHDAIFSMKTKTNDTLIFATTNHENFTVFNTEIDKNKDGGRCDFCKIDFEHSAIGYPIAYEEKEILMDKENQEAVYKIFYIFWTEGCMCSFECCMGYLIKNTDRSVCNRDPVIKDSIELLTNLYRLTHPNGKKLRPSQDHRLLGINGGSLTEKEWVDCKHIYSKTSRVVTIPCKTAYLMESYYDK